jgi:hypothetical protein
MTSRYATVTRMAIVATAEATDRNRSITPQRRRGRFRCVAQRRSHV